MRKLGWRTMFLVNGTIEVAGCFTPVFGGTSGPADRVVWFELNANRRFVWD